jgi:hypothetical protein
MGISSKPLARQALRPSVTVAVKQMGDAALIEGLSYDGKRYDGLGLQA